MQCRPWVLGESPGGGRQAREAETDGIKMAPAGNKGKCGPGKCPNTAGRGGSAPAAAAVLAAPRGEAAAARSHALDQGVAIGEIGDEGRGEQAKLGHLRPRRNPRGLRRATLAAQT